MRDFPRALSELQVIARNCNWFIALFVPVVIGRSSIALVLVLRQSFENRSILVNRTIIIIRLVIVSMHTI